MPPSAYRVIAWEPSITNYKTEISEFSNLEIRNCGNSKTSNLPRFSKYENPEFPKLQDLKVPNFVKFYNIEY